MSQLILGAHEGDTLPISSAVEPDRRARIQALAFEPEQFPRERFDSCDLCSKTVFRIVSHVDRYGFNGTYQMCESCGLVFQSPHPTPEGYEGFYKHQYRPLLTAYKGRPENAESIQRDQHDYARGLVDFLSPHIKQLQEAADLGGSTGIVARVLEQAFGGHCLVVDPSPDELRVAKQLGLNTHLAIAERWEPKGTYDLITICRSIDHCLSISSVLDKIHSALTPSGLLFVDFNDFETAALVEPDYRKRLKIDHVFYPSNTIMRAYFNKCGFRIVATDFAKYQPAFLVQRAQRQPLPELSEYAYRLGALLRQRLVAPTPSYPVDGLTRLARRVKALGKG